VTGAMHFSRGVEQDLASCTSSTIVSNSSSFFVGCLHLHGPLQADTTAVHHEHELHVHDAAYTIQPSIES
jgi:hypothetical protein